MLGQAHTPRQRLLLLAVISFAVLAVPAVSGALPSHSAPALRAHDAALAAKSRAAVLDLYSLDQKLAAAQSRLGALERQTESLRAERASLPVHLHLETSHAGTVVQQTGDVRVRNQHQLTIGGCGVAYSVLANAIDQQIGAAVLVETEQDSSRWGALDREWRILDDDPSRSDGLEARSSADQGKAKSLYDDAQKIIVTDAPNLFLANQNQFLAYSPKLTNFTPMPDETWQGLITAGLQP